MEISDAYVQRKVELREEHLPFDVEAWYPLISELTFPTTFINITPEQAEAIRGFYITRYNNRKNEFQMNQVKLIKELEQTLDEVLSLKQFEFGSFVRFSSRSPKDGVPYTIHDFESSYNSSLLNIIEKDKQYPVYHGDIIANQKMRAFCQASSKCWRVMNAKDAMNLILSSKLVTSFLSLSLSNNAGMS